MKRFAVLASGSGTNLQALIDAAASGQIDGTLALVVTNRPGSGAQGRAQRHGIPLAVLDHKVFPSRRSFDAAVAEALDTHHVDWVVLAGFMRILTPEFVQRYRGRIVNIHPSMLPAFRGNDAVGAALAAGATTTGVTVHFVDEGVDTGAIIAQEAVTILTGDTRESLHARMHAVEHRLYPEVVHGLVTGGISPPLLTEMPAS